MLAVWISLGVSVALMTVTGLRTFRQGRRAFKDATRFTNGLETRLTAVNRSTLQLERSAAKIEGSSARLQTSLARLDVSRRRLKVLTDALAESRSALDRLGAFLPRS